MNCKIESNLKSSKMSILSLIIVLCSSSSFQFGFNMNLMNLNREKEADFLMHLNHIPIFNNENRWKILPKQIEFELVRLIEIDKEYNLTSSQLMQTLNMSNFKHLKQLKSKLVKIKKEIQFSNFTNIKKLRNHILELNEYLIKLSKLKHKNHLYTRV